MQQRRLELDGAAGHGPQVHEHHDAGLTELWHTHQPHLLAVGACGTSRKQGPEGSAADKPIESVEEKQHQHQQQGQPALPRAKVDQGALRTCGLLCGKLGLVPHEVAVRGVAEDKGVPVRKGESREGVWAGRGQVAPLQRGGHDLEPVLAWPKGCSRQQQR